MDLFFILHAQVSFFKFKTCAAFQWVNTLKRPGTTLRMVSALCADYVLHRVGVIARAAAQDFADASADRVGHVSRLAVEAFKAGIYARLHSPALVYDLDFS
ncbi:hypothetical protein EC845_0134 [Comamonas sp. BIGb0124]|uniref:hypothetical protein n=1 Tax=Comamonas sp. BIGb0124 TaxID=2485130 RepID=UPI000F460BB2|nr:hypothetical protein [Comamonas sp. BIGb0124]ROR26573.1 hypothetical protein EC845_0134 [Comamonas sp. BIGb0124]